MKRSNKVRSLHVKLIVDKDYWILKLIVFRTMLLLLLLLLLHSFDNSPNCYIEMFFSNTSEFLMENEKPSLIIKIQNAKPQFHSVLRFNVISSVIH